MGGVSTNQTDRMHRYMTRERTLGTAWRGLKP